MRRFVSVGLVLVVLPVLAACQGVGGGTMGGQPRMAVAVRAPQPTRPASLANPDTAKIPTPKPSPLRPEAAKSSTQQAAMLPAPSAPSVTVAVDDPALAAIPSNLGTPADIMARAKAISQHLQAAGNECTTPTAYNAVLRRSLTEAESRYFTPARTDKAVMEVASVSLCNQPPQMMQAYVVNTVERRQIVDVLMLGPSAVDPVIALRVHTALKQIKDAVQSLPKGCPAWKIIGSERVGEKRADSRSPERWRYGACGAKIDVTLTVPAPGAAGPLDDVRVVPG